MEPDDGNKEKTPRLDLFALMEKWREEDSDEDIAYMEEFRRELMALRRHDRL